MQCMSVLCRKLASTLERTGTNCEPLNDPLLGASIYALLSLSSILVQVIHIDDGELVLVATMLDKKFTVQMLLWCLMTTSWGGQVQWYM